MRALDLTNKRFGRLVAIEVTYKENKRSWLCKCDCGNEVIVPTFYLTSGNNSSCGCGRNGVDIGDVFGLLTIVEIAGYDKYGKRGNRLRVKCACECGGYKTTFSRNLTRGSTVHCGCKKAENHSRAKRGEYGVGIMNTLVYAYKRNAEKRELSFELSDEQVVGLFSGCCHYCGESPSKIVTKKNMYGSFTYNGIDRLDNDLGYSVGNSVSCCETCNYLKNSYSETEFLDIVEKIARHCNLLQVEPPR